MNVPNLKIDDYLAKTKKWGLEIGKLRAILLECGLNEELKWGNPCYMFNNKNIILIGSYKDCCVISFLKGVLLQDSNGILIQPGENSQSAKIIKFYSLQEIIKIEAKLKAYIYEAIEIEKAGLKVSLKDNSELIFPDEFLQKLVENSALKTAF